VEGDQGNKTGHKSSPPIRTSQGTWTRSNAEKEHAFDKQLAQVLKKKKLLPSSWKPLPTPTTNQPPSQSRSPRSHIQIRLQEIAWTPPHHQQNFLSVAFYWNRIRYSNIQRHRA
jgi:hypothetical protein